MNRQFNRWALALAVAAALAGPAQAQTGDQAQASPAVSGNTTVHLIRLLVEQGVITEEQAGALMEQARREARAEQEAREPDVREGDVRVPYIPKPCATGSAPRSRKR